MLLAEQSSMSAIQIITMICGIIGSICITIYAYPPLIKCLKTKDTSGISYPMFIILCVGSTFFVLDGLLGVISILADKNASLSDGTTLASFISFIAVGVANLSSSLGAYWSVIYKTIHIRDAKKHNMSEKEWCDKIANEKRLAKAKKEAH